jgi:ABC-type glycerol-3-phosphate transport system permease component
MRGAGTTIAVHVALGLAAAFTLAPLVWLVAATFKNSQDLFAYTFFPPPARLSTEHLEKLLGTSRLYDVDLKSYEQLCQRLREAARQPPPAPRSPAQRVYELLSPEAQASLARGAPLDEGGKALLLRELNRILARADFYQAEDFHGVELSSQVLAWLERRAELPGEDIERLNRHLLVAAFPESIAALLIQMPFSRYMANSFFVTGVLVLIQLFFCSLAGFALAKYEFRFKKLIMVLMLGTMMIPGQVLLAPMYELIHRLGLMDSYLGLIVPGMVSVFGIFLFRQSMLSVPNELLEAGRIDGCTEFGLYWRLVVPVSRPMIGAFCLVAFMGTWNSFLWPQIILHSKHLFTLAIGLNSLVGSTQDQQGLLMAGTFLSVLPVMVLFFILQKEFISGLTAGAVKG